MTVEEMFRLYLFRTRARRSNHTQRKTGSKVRVLTDILSELGYEESSSISAATWADLVDALQKRYAPSTARNYARLYKTVLRWAADRGIIDEGQVCEGEMELSAQQEQPDRYLTADEIEKLLSSLEGDWMQLPCALGIYQGLRRGEIRNLRGGDVDLDAMMLAVGTTGRTKNRKHRRIPIHSSLPQYLPKPLPGEDEWLASDENGCQRSANSITMAFRRRADAVGLGDVRFHDLRHTCASQMALSGDHTLYEISTFLGHSDIQTTQRYAHLLPSDISLCWNA